MCPRPILLIVENYLHFLMHDQLWFLFMVEQIIIYCFCNIACDFNQKVVFLICKFRIKFAHTMLPDPRF